MPFRQNAHHSILSYIRLLLGLWWMGQETYFSITLALGTNMALTMPQVSISKSQPMISIVVCFLKQNQLRCRHLQIKDENLMTAENTMFVPSFLAPPIMQSSKSIKGVVAIQSMYRMIGTWKPSKDISQQLNKSKDDVLLNHMQVRVPCFISGLLFAMQPYTVIEYFTSVSLLAQILGFFCTSPQKVSHPVFVDITKKHNTTACSDENYKKARNKTIQKPPNKGECAGGTLRPAMTASPMPVTFAR